MNTGMKNRITIQLHMSEKQEPKATVATESSTNSCELKQKIKRLKSMNKSYDQPKYATISLLNDTDIVQKCAEEIVKNCEIPKPHNSKHIRHRAHKSLEDLSSMTKISKKLLSSSQNKPKKKQSRKTYVPISPVDFEKFSCLNQFNYEKRLQKQRNLSLLHQFKLEKITNMHKS